MPDYKILGILSVFRGPSNMTFILLRTNDVKSNYGNAPKYSDNRKIAVIILKFEQCVSIIE